MLPEIEDVVELCWGGQHLGLGGEPQLSGQRHESLGQGAHGLRETPGLAIMTWQHTQTNDSMKISNNWIKF